MVDPAFIKIAFRHRFHTFEVMFYNFEMKKRRFQSKVLVLLGQIISFLDHDNQGLTSISSI